VLAASLEEKVVLVQERDAKTAPRVSIQNSGVTIANKLWRVAIVTVPTVTLRGGLTPLLEARFGTNQIFERRRHRHLDLAGLCLHQDSVHLSQTLGSACGVVRWKKATKNVHAVTSQRHKLLMAQLRMKQIFKRLDLYLQRLDLHLSRLDIRPQLLDLQLQRLDLHLTPCLHTLFGALCAAAISTPKLNTVQTVASMKPDDPPTFNELVNVNQLEGLYLPVEDLPDTCRPISAGEGLAYEKAAWILNLAFRT